MTSQQLTYKALRKLGCLRTGQTTSPDMLTDAFELQNEMLERFKLDKLMVIAQRGDLYTLTAGVQTYLIGPTAPAPFNVKRPTRIEEANILLNTGFPPVRQPIDILTAAEWAAIQVQNIPYAIPLAMWYDGNFNQTTGNATINLWPGPLSAYQLELYTWQQLELFATQTTNYLFPPGYQNMLVWNFAKEFAAEARIQFKMPPQMFDTQYAMVMAMAQESKAEIESYNAPDVIMTVDGAFLGGRRQGAFNYLTGNTGRSS